MEKIALNGSVNGLPRFLAVALRGGLKTMGFQECNKF
jgi:hypothetical protein